MVYTGQNEFTSLSGVKKWVECEWVKVCNKSSANIKEFWNNAIKFKCDIRKIPVH